MVPVAHRGHWWPDRATQNQLSAIQAATKAGYGLELDARMLPFNGEPALVFQHERGDTPFLIGGPNDDWDLLLQALKAAPVILWDIKELQAIRPLLEWLTRHQLLASALLFDLEIADDGDGTFPDLPRFTDGQPVPYLRRASESDRESLYDAAADEYAAGIWLDAWDAEWVGENTISMVHAVGKRAYVCSSELHQRPIRPEYWRIWASADGICTDFPHLLAALEVDRRPELHAAGWHAEVHR